MTVPDLEPRRGVWNQLFLLAAPAVALAPLTLEGGTDATLLIVAVIGLVVFALALATFVAALLSNRLARWVGNNAARGASRLLGLIGRRPVASTMPRPPGVPRRRRRQL